MRELKAYPDRDLLMLGLADALAGELAAALRSRETASFCVPGGTTPGPLFDILSAVEVDWARVRVVLNDERWVPESDPRSNTAMVKARLFTGFAAAAEWVPLYSRAAETPGAAAEALSQGLEPHLPLDVLLLGMGEDLHTASLFPGDPDLAQALAPTARAVEPARQPGSAEARVTLSARVLGGALSKHILITGEQKRAALVRAQDLAQDAAPIRAVWSEAVVHWAV